MNSNHGYHGNKLPRYFITIGNDVVFDYPKDFDTTRRYGENSYPWDGEICDISNVIEEYIQCPESEIMLPFENDVWGITDIMRACDRRLGKRRLKEIKEKTTDKVILNIIDKRLGTEITETEKPSAPCVP
jgi:hypothetical protein